MRRELRIGTRGSLLAVAQAQQVATALQRWHPDLEPVLVKITTSGDRMPHIPLAAVGGKGLFIKEIEEALLEKVVDVAVHSMKDVPTDTAPGLLIAAILERQDPSDALISRRGEKLRALPPGATVGTSSLRRQSQLLYHRPDLTVAPLRGNLDTRLRKLRTEGLDAVVVAAAGMRRLGREGEITEILPVEVSVPAVAQGALGVEVRTEDTETRDLVRPLHHPASALTVAAERAFLARLGGGCQVPIAAHARVGGGELHLVALVCNPDGTTMVRGERRGPAHAPEELGVDLAGELLQRGADRIVRELSAQSLEPPAAP